MKKYVISIFSLLLLISPVFSYDFFVWSSWGNNYLCYFNSYSTYNSSSRSYKYNVSPFYCWSITENHNFIQSFQINTISSPFTISNVSYSAGYNLRFFSNWLKLSNQVDYLNNSSRYFSFPTSSLTSNISYPWQSFQHSLVYVNFNRWSFLVFDWKNIAWSLYNNYFFTWYDYFNDVSSYFYNIDISTSSSFVSWNSVGFVSIFDDWFSTDNFWKIINMNTKIDWLLLVPLMDYWYDYLTWSHTLLMKFIDWQLVYNILDCFSSKSSFLKNCDVVDRWYFNDLSFFNWSWYSYNITPSYIGSYIYKYYKFAFYSWNVISLYWVQWYNISWSYYSDFITLYKSFELTSNSSVSDILSTVNFPLTTWDAYSWSVRKCINDINYYNLNTSFCNSIWVFIGSNWIPVLNTSLSWASCLKLVKMYDDNWNLIEKMITCEEAQSYLSWWLFTDSQWNIFYQCFWDSCLYTNTSQYFQSWLVSSSYYNSDSLFFSCPYPIITWFNSLLTNFSNIELWQFSIWLPIICFYSSFQAWKNYTLFSWLTSYIDTPLMWLISSSDDDRNYLYKFFDIILCIWILMFLLKLYHLTK